MKKFPIKLKQHDTKLIEKCIDERWRPIVDAYPNVDLTQQIYANSFCKLCQYYNNCTDCPLSKRYKLDCSTKGSVYDNWIDTLSKEDAQAVLDALEELLTMPVED